MLSATPITWHNTHAAVERVAQFYEQLAPERLPELGTCYAARARFSDPFNEVVGLASITQVFEHMFEVLDGPRFVITQRLVQGNEAVLAWEFHFRFRRWRRVPAQCVEGVSWLQFDGDGRVVRHRDHWDAARLYEAFPLIGALLRGLRRGASATTGHSAS